MIDITWQSANSKEMLGVELGVQTIGLYQLSLEAQKSREKRWAKRRTADTGIEKMRACT